VVGTILFIYIIFDIFTNNNFSSKNPWLIIGYYLGLNKEIENNEIELTSSNTIEWTLDSPIPMHAFNSLPAQS
jgi:hypothetical protein